MGLLLLDIGSEMIPEMINAILDHNYATHRGAANEKGVGVGLQMVINQVEKIGCRFFYEVSKGTIVWIVF